MLVCIMNASINTYTNIPTSLAPNQPTNLRTNKDICIRRKGVYGVCMLALKYLNGQAAVVFASSGISAFERLTRAPFLLSRSCWRPHGDNYRRCSVCSLGAGWEAAEEYGGHPLPPGASPQQPRKRLHYLKFLNSFLIHHRQVYQRERE